MLNFFQSLLIGIIAFFGGYYVLTVNDIVITPQKELVGVISCRDNAAKGIEQRIAECPIPASEKASFKGKEIAKIKTIAKQKIQDYFIEVIDMKAIDSGVELYARAWNLDGSQIGFGKDGSVDIERFIFINPPILVDDPNGTIVREWNDKITGQLQQTRLRENPQEAILLSLTHTIKVKQQKFGSKNIIAGKIGNTTLTACPQPSTGTAPIDGQTEKASGLGSGTDFATLRAAAGGSVDNTGGAADTLLGSDNVTDKYRLLYRGGFGFDTSIIGSNNVDSSTLSFYSRPGGAGIGLGDTNGQIVDFNPADGSLFAAGDHVNYGTTLYSDTSILISTIDAVSQYYDFPLNASGITNINKTGNSYFGRRLQWDVENSFTGTWATDNSSNWQSWAADDAGTTRDPKLVVEYSAAAAVAVTGEEYFIINEE